MSLPLAFGFGSPVDLFIVALVLLPSLFWVVIFTHFVGALVYYLVGRKQGIAPISPGFSAGIFRVQYVSTPTKRMPA